MNWIKYPLLPIALFGTFGGLVLAASCETEHGRCVDNFVCVDTKFTNCSGEKFVCSDVKGCEY
ncbi:MAG: hypothetical protein PHQ76_02010 [Caldisericia bacterium]|nr:hypothetical protein [Caldisericia bacterium]MDD5689037.1 hypothetical protein [Caldisericia bacterium]